jgi:hypothetical protein
MHSCMQTGASDPHHAAMYVQGGPPCGTSVTLKQGVTCPPSDTRPQTLVSTLWRMHMPHHPRDAPSTHTPKHACADASRLPATTLLKHTGQCLMAPCAVLHHSCCSELSTSIAPPTAAAGADPASHSSPVPMGAAGCCRDAPTATPRPKAAMLTHLPLYTSPVPDGLPAAVPTRPQFTVLLQLVPCWQAFSAPRPEAASYTPGAMRAAAARLTATQLPLTAFPVSVAFRLLSQPAHTPAAAVMGQPHSSPSPMGCLLLSPLAHSS